MRKILVIVAVGAVSLALVGAATGRSAATKLNGTVGPSFTISLMKGSAKVTTLKAGTYSITVSDRASIHNFVLEQTKGGKFERAITAVPFVGTKTVTVKLTRGSWEYYCKPHESVMKGRFTVK
jgi:plastocyanin